MDCCNEMWTILNEDLLPAVICTEGIDESNEIFIESMQRNLSIRHLAERFFNNVREDEEMFEQFPFGFCGEKA